MKTSFGFLLMAFLPYWSEASSMADVDWDSSHEAEIVFCENGGAYGYKLADDTSSSCDPAGVLVRMSPGTSYKLTLRNEASVVTNLHTHGLHISGAGNSDDPFRKVDPGMCLVYHWDIPSDHMGGTFWMHAHVHGLTNSQVSGGAFAMLIIEENDSVIGDSAVTDDSAIKEWYNNELLLVASRTGNTMLGNGLSNYEIDMNSNEWYRLRTVAVDPNGRTATLEFPSSCTVYAAAHDGVWRFQVPKVTSSTTYELTGASRLDVAIKCTSGGSISWGRKTVATLNVGVGGGIPSGAYPFTSSGGSWSSHRPDYLRDLRGSGDFQTYEIQMTAAQINGQSFDPNVPLGDWEYESLQEWTISSSGAHPFHLHIYHMQAVSEGCSGVHDVGEYYDTISSKSSCLVRFPITDYGESVMMHCHVLSHEDNGSMTWLNVVGDFPPQSQDQREQLACPGSTPITPEPSSSPSSPPTRDPSSSPSGSPTAVTPQSSSSPTGSPITDAPSSAPTGSPITETPSSVPTGSPIIDAPSSAPTGSPITDAPSSAPTGSPVAAPVCANEEEFCRFDSDCCSDNCSNGRPEFRVCLARRLLRG